jgi:4'-phosphopantetheinyl transferase
VLCSISTRQPKLQKEETVHLGCDIQERKGAPLHLAERYFCESEYQTILQHGEKQKQIETFFRFWVLKESFMKATRQGIRLPMNQFEIELGDPPRLVRQPDMFSRNYVYHEYVVEKIPYQIAVCSTDTEIEDVIHTDISFGM